MVLWEDSFGVVPDWRGMEDIDDKECLIESVGYVIKATKKRYILASNYDVKTKQFCGAITIPTSAVRKWISLSFQLTE